MTDPSFRVTFFKVLVDHYGHRHDCVQRAIELAADDEATALEKARKRFAELSEVPRWELRADYALTERLPRRRPVGRRSA